MSEIQTEIVASTEAEVAETVQKVLLVASPIQKLLMDEVLLNEIQNGFWVGMRPANHSEVWEGVTVEVASENTVGPVGFTPRKNYDFLNPTFTPNVKDRMVELAQTIKPTMTWKALKKELIELARIVGGRMTDKSREPARAYRGNNRDSFDVIRVVNRQRILTVAEAKQAVDEAEAKVSAALSREEMAD